jgi:hypothetical protein
MSTRARITSIGLILVLAGCGGTDVGGSTTEASATSTTEPVSATSTTKAEHATSIPLGTYVKVDTREGLLASGVDEKTIDSLFGSADEFRYTLKIADGLWSQFVSVDGSPDELGDKGTYTYDDGLWVTTSESTGCPGCVGAIEWELDGDALTLRIDWDHSSGDPEQQKTSIVVDGVYEKTG